MDLSVTLQESMMFLVLINVLFAAEKWDSSNQPGFVEIYNASREMLSDQHYSQPDLVDEITAAGVYKRDVIEDATSAAYYDHKHAKSNKTTK